MKEWRVIQRENFVSWKRLVSFLSLCKEDQEQIDKACHTFPLNLPLRLAEKIEKKNLRDPILMQFLPTLKEKERDERFSTDPVGDQLAMKSCSLLHKYQGRALLITTGACVMHCRYCFRQNFDYQVNKEYERELEMIREDSSIHEVILSGGDPLSLGDQRLKSLLDRLEQIFHVKKVRFHTRFPIGIPERIDSNFLDLITERRFQVIFVLHSNHPSELDSDIFRALKEVQKLGIPVLNQTVLLKGINDSKEVLVNLFTSLSDQGVIPYYLHQLDPVQGAKYFEVEESRGIELMQQIREVLPGYAVPLYVRERAGERSKTPIA